MKNTAIERFCMVGAGYMGAQIALRSAIYGCSARLVDTNVAALDLADERIKAELDQHIANGDVPAGEREEILSRIQYSMNLEQALSGAQLVIEATPERLEVKREVFRELDRLSAPATVLATNSSSIRISLIEDVTQRPERLLNIHYYAPVWERPMVDVAPGAKTNEETLALAMTYCRQTRVTPLLVRKESTGFVFNRVWRAVKKDCLRLVDEGVASFEDVDRAWIIWTGMELGPFGTMDLIGLDVVRDIEQVYYEESGDPHDTPPKLLLDKIERGELGVKTGTGFYTYPNPAYEDPEWLRGEPQGD